MDSASSAALFLAAVAISDGLRLLPTEGGAIVISRLGAGDWRLTLASDPDDLRGMRMLTWCSPLDMPLVLREMAARGLPLRRRVVRCRARRRRSRHWVSALRIWGMLTLAALVVAVPWLTSRSGVWGLLAGVSLVLALSLLQAAVAALAMRRVGSRPADAALSSLRFLWPFSGPRAAEEVMRQATGDVPPLVLLSELLPHEDFARFARPLLYDAVERGMEDASLAELREWIGDARVRDIIEQAPPVVDGDAFCPRCGTCFYGGTRFCADCAGIELRVHAAA